MKKSAFLILACAAAVFVGGCFKNQSKPQDVATTIGLDALAKTNRAEVVRLILRGTKQPIAAEAVKGLAKLASLDVSECGLKNAPLWVADYAGLKELYLVRDELTALPDDYGKLVQLRYLNLDGNRFEKLPGVVAKLTGLKWLRLNENKLTELPADLSALRDLRRIYLKRNQLPAVPPALEALKTLEDIALDYNPIAEVPQWLTAFPKLRSVSFAGCRLTKLPTDLSGWKKLDSLVFSGCPIPEGEIKRVRAALPDVAIVF